MNDLEIKALELCPLDGRYNDIKELLSPYFSEYAYIKYRVLVEVKWLVYLIKKEIAPFVNDTKINDENGELNRRSNRDSTNWYGI